jgi:hypothetical protein
MSESVSGLQTRTTTLNVHRGCVLDRKNIGMCAVLVSVIHNSNKPGRRKIIVRDWTRHGGIRSQMECKCVETKSKKMAHQWVGCGRLV